MRGKGARGYPLYSWGLNEHGQLGLGDTVNRNTPQRVGNDEWLFVSAGGKHSLGINKDGYLFSWGDNRNGQLGLGDLINRSTPTRVGDSNGWLAVSAGSNFWSQGGHSLAFHADGKLLGFGLARDGELGYMPSGSTNSVQPVEINEGSFPSIAACNRCTFVLRADNLLFCTGDGSGYQTGQGTENDIYAFTQVGDSLWREIRKSNSGHNLMIRDDGLLFGCGRNTNGALGLGYSYEIARPSQIGSDKWITASGGFMYSLAIREDRRLFATGDNRNKQLGLGLTDNYIVAFTQVGSSEWLTASAGGELDMGGGHSLAIRNDKRLFVWGYNVDGELGLGDNENRNTPVQLGNDEWHAISAGGKHTLALMEV